MTGIAHEFEDFKWEIKWERFSKKCKTPEMVVLLTMDGTIDVLMRRFFETDHDWEQAQQLIDSNVVEPK